MKTTSILRQGFAQAFRTHRKRGPRPWRARRQTGCHDTPPPIDLDRYQPVDAFCEQCELGSIVFSGQSRSRSVSILMAAKFPKAVLTAFAPRFRCC
jgi:hypothetical protein